MEGKSLAGRVIDGKVFRAETCTDSRLSTDVSKANSRSQAKAALRDVVGRRSSPMMVADLWW